MRYNKSQLLALLRLHADTEQPSPMHSEDEMETMPAPSTRRGLASNQVRIMHGAMSMHDVRVVECMTPVERISMLDVDNTKLGLSTLAHLVYLGHSRIPVYKGDRNHIVGVLLTKKLIALSPDDERPVSTMSLRAPLFVHRMTTLSQVMRAMKASKSHMAIVVSHPAHMAAEARGGPPCQHGVVLGCITLLDVVQRLVDERLDDEDTPARPIVKRTSVRDTVTEDGRISILAAGRLRAWVARARQRHVGDQAAAASELLYSTSGAEDTLAPAETSSDYVRLGGEDEETGVVFA